MVRDCGSTTEPFIRTLAWKRWPEGVSTPSITWPSRTKLSMDSGAARRTSRWSTSVTVTMGVTGMRVTVSPALWNLAVTTPAKGAAMTVSASICFAPASAARAWSSWAAATSRPVFTRS